MTNIPRTRKEQHGFTLAYITIWLHSSIYGYIARGLTFEVVTPKPMHVWRQKIISQNIYQWLSCGYKWFQSPLLWQISAGSLIYMIYTYRSAMDVFLFVVFLNYFQEAVPRGSVSGTLWALYCTPVEYSISEFKQSEWYRVYPTCAGLRNFTMSYINIEFNLYNVVLSLIELKKWKKSTNETTNAGSNTHKKQTIKNMKHREKH